MVLHLCIRPAMDLWPFQCGIGSSFPVTCNGYVVQKMSEFVEHNMPWASFTFISVLFSLFEINYVILKK